MDGEELINILNEYESKDKSDWEFLLLTILPENQVNDSFLKRLIIIFQNLKNNNYILQMQNYIKYEKAFEKYKEEKVELENHNIISFLISIFLSKEQKTKYDIGANFFVECSRYFQKQTHLFKKVYLTQKEIDKYFDYDGKALEAILKLDSTFFIECLKQTDFIDDYLVFENESFKLDYIWTLPNFEDLVDESLNIIIDQRPFFSNWDDTGAVLFPSQKSSEEIQERAIKFLDKYMTKNITEKKKVSVVLSIVMHKFNKHFINFIKRFLTINKDFEVFKCIYLDRGGVTFGSRVPYIQNEIDFCKKIIEVVNEFPDILAYSDHLEYLEQRILWHNKDMKREQRREFQEEHLLY